MKRMLDLQGYFERIGWEGHPSPDLKTLAELLGAHMLSIPFENLDVLLGRPIRLDLTSLQNKLVRSKRGGYCFEHATLLAAVLEDLGFRVTRHTARVTVHSAPTEAPRTHMILVINLPEGRFVVDPGFGGFGPRVPVPLKDSVKVSAANECHWLVEEDGQRVLHFQDGDKDVAGWVTRLDPDNLIDFEVGNHYTSTHPDSQFRKHLMIAIRTPKGRVTAMDRQATIRQGSEERSFRLERPQDLRALLNEYFKFDLPEAKDIPIWD